MLEDFIHLFPFWIFEDESDIREVFSAELHSMSPFTSAGSDIVSYFITPETFETPGWKFDQDEFRPFWIRREKSWKSAKGALATHTSKRWAPSFVSVDLGFDRNLTKGWEFLESVLELCSDDTEICVFSGMYDLNEYCDSEGKSCQMLGIPDFARRRRVSFYSKNATPDEFPLILKRLRIAAENYKLRKKFELVRSSAAIGHKELLVAFQNKWPALISGGVGTGKSNLVRGLVKMWSQGDGSPVCTIHCGQFVGDGGVDRFFGRSKSGADELGKLPLAIQKCQKTKNGGAIVLAGLDHLPEAIQSQLAQYFEDGFKDCNIEDEMQVLEKCWFVGFVNPDTTERKRYLGLNSELASIFSGFLFDIGDLVSDDAHLSNLTTVGFEKAQQLTSRMSENELRNALSSASSYGLSYSEVIGVVKRAHAMELTRMTGDFSTHLALSISSIVKLRESIGDVDRK